jgi:hypothetical protein
MVLDAKCNGFAIRTALVMSNLLPPSRIRRANHLHLISKNSAGRPQHLRTRTRHVGILFGVRFADILEGLALEQRA